MVFLKHIKNLFFSKSLFIFFCFSFVLLIPFFSSLYAMEEKDRSSVKRKAPETAKEGNQISKKQKREIFPLNNLPNELLSHIFTFTDPSALNTLKLPNAAKTCKRFYEIWKRLRGIAVKITCSISWENERPESLFAQQARLSNNDFFKMNESSFKGYRVNNLAGIDIFLGKRKEERKFSTFSPLEYEYFISPTSMENKPSLELLHLPLSHFPLSISYQLRSKGERKSSLDGYSECAVHFPKIDDPKTKAVGLISFSEEKQGWGEINSSVFFDKKVAREQRLRFPEVTLLFHFVPDEDGEDIIPRLYMFKDGDTKSHLINP